MIVEAKRTSNRRVGMRLRARTGNQSSFNHRSVPADCRSAEIIVHADAPDLIGVFVRDGRVSDQAAGTRRGARDRPVE